MPQVNVTMLETRKVSGVAEVSQADIKRLFLETQTAQSLVNHARTAWVHLLFPSERNPEELRICHGRWEAEDGEHPHCGSMMYRTMRTATDSELQLWALFSNSYSLILETTK